MPECVCLSAYVMQACASPCIALPWLSGRPSVAASCVPAPDWRACLPRTRSVNWKGSKKKKDKKGKDKGQDLYALLGLQNERFMATEKMIKDGGWGKGGEHVVNIEGLEWPGERKRPLC